MALGAVDVGQDSVRWMLRHHIMPIIWIGGADESLLTSSGETYDMVSVLLSLCSC